MSANHEDRKFGKIGDRPDYIRTGSVFIRAAHLLAAGVVVGAYLLEPTTPHLHSWLMAAGFSGLLLVGTEFWRHRELYRETAGWTTVLKVVLIALIPVFKSQAAALAVTGFLIASVGAHLPRRYRHRRLF